MQHFFLVFIAFIALIVILAVSVSIGRMMGYKHLQQHPQQKLEIVSVAESAVFALLALLIAFTFSGAYDRFEHRKYHLIEEANTFDRAYNYIDLFPADRQHEMRLLMRAYFDCYLEVFNHVPYKAKIKVDLQKAHQLENQIWEHAVAASNEISNKTLAQVYLPTINDMFEVAHTGYYMTGIHPPPVIFLLLLVLSALGGFLVGYNSAENKHKRPLHSLCYVLLTAFTIYIIVNMEYPRVGFIGMKDFDSILIQVRYEMNEELARHK